MPKNPLGALGDFFFSREEPDGARDDPPGRGMSGTPQQTEGQIGTIYTPDPRSAPPRQPAAPPRQPAAPPRQPAAPPRQPAPRAEVPPREPRNWRPRLIGTPIEVFEPLPPVTNSYRPDYVADGWSTRNFTVRLASVRGYVHRFRGLPRQDDIAVAHHRPSGAIVFAVADGVSAAPHSHLGATAACRAAVGAITAGLDAEDTSVNWQNVVERAAWQLVEQARVLLDTAEVTPERAERELASTLVAGMVCPTANGPLASIVQVGDSSAWVLSGGGFRCVLEAKYSAGDEVVSSAVSGLPRVPQVKPRIRPLATGEVLLVGTDGFGDPLGDGSGAVAKHFAERLAQPLSPLNFAYDLDFSRETFDDDRTLLAIWPRTT
ncbi:protein phosphatase 2C domain-containing protein [Couchioplanes caeruleus]|uniref:PPM-type phosphatase domain-containing protein n=2 Tax=Couchioplanes caeruleus TaxID=56438 RepID=A0A1K0GD28_9ACTN|nr:protein phosphatase 2C domain-containing protein [Couchioplanes caeruleus]OJF10070.1 hypothetical protein BG844_34060 [Couchioplanes caeruleus subsp. caeruleus]ROP31371.1 protein phosphatase 2C-like protein [Couchioplanes caeruleus]